MNGINGIILFPDSYTHPAGVPNIGNTNATGRYYTDNPISSAGWASMEAAGAVFLPAAGYRNNITVYNVNSYGYYWASTMYNYQYAYTVYFYNGYLSPNYSTALVRCYGAAVRLVQDVN